ncbi:hypothetical protein [Streptomyces sp. UH6]|uniref:hypothetical protein n=1 Tax=Streptomyces sp. UH6 TaxID=2748379 RepID=UPI0015D49B3A|nr:hypothetical protein [Streptomyces sp. UH6]NYV74550.1 hypothetical protein [Streptomyces sp. UH6]
MDDSLSFESFLAGAKKAAHRAMDDHGRAEYDEFALHSGVAVERLAKAVLAKRNPVYLVEMRNGPSDMLLHFGGHLEMEPEKVRTVGANEALKRLRRMAVLPSDPQLDLLIELRNGTAHTTVGDQAKTLLPTLAETVGTLLTDIGMPVERFWGRWTSAIHVAIDKHRDEIQRDVQVRIRQAKNRFEDRFGNLPSDLLDGMQRPLQNRRSGWFAAGIHHETGRPGPPMGWFPCPACGNKAVAVLASRSEDAEGEPDIFSCTLCGLNLAGVDEYTAAGIKLPETPSA